MSTASTVDRVDQVDPIERVTQRRVPAAQAPRPATTGPSSVFALASAAGAGAAAGDDGNAPPAAAEPLTLTARARATFQACGRISAAQLATALEVTHFHANKLIAGLVRDGDVVADGKDGRTPKYRPRAGTSAQPHASGLKGWLAKSAAPQVDPALGAVTRGRGGPAGPVAAAPAPPAAKRRRTSTAVTTLPSPPAQPEPAEPARPEAHFSGNLVTRTAGVHLVTLQQLNAMVTPDPTGPLTLGLFSTGEIVIERGAESMRLTPRQARQLVDWALLADLSLPA